MKAQTTGVKETRRLVETSGLVFTPLQQPEQDFALSHENTPSKWTLNRPDLVFRLEQRHALHCFPSAF